MRTSKVGSRANDQSRTRERYKSDRLIIIVSHQKVKFNLKVPQTAYAVIYIFRYPNIKESVQNIGQLITKYVFESK